MLAPGADWENWVVRRATTMAKMMTMARRVMSSAEIWPEEDLAGGWTEKEAAGEAGRNIFGRWVEACRRRESMGKGRRTRFKRVDYDGLNDSLNKEYIRKVSKWPRERLNKPEAK